MLMAALVLALSGASREAHAILITPTTSNFTITYDQPVSGYPDLTATATYSLVSFTSGVLDLSVTIDNTTNASFPNARLTAVGFNLSAPITGATATSSVYSAFLNQNFPSFQTLALCLSSGTNCAGGGNGGLLPGQSDTFNLTIDGSFSTSPSVTLDTPASKFQTGIGSYETAGTITGGGCTSNCGGNNVSEPSTLPILGAGLIAIYFATRRRLNGAVKGDNANIAVAISSSHHGIALILHRVLHRYIADKLVDGHRVAGVLKPLDGHGVRA